MSTLHYSSARMKRAYVTGANTKMHFFFRRFTVQIGFRVGSKWPYLVTKRLNLVAFIYQMPFHILKICCFYLPQANLATKRLILVSFIYQRLLFGYDLLKLCCFFYLRIYFVDKDSNLVAFIYHRGLFGFQTLKFCGFYLPNAVIWLFNDETWLFLLS